MGRPKTPPRPAKCLECSIAFETTRGAHFCCAAHKKAFHRRLESEGRALIALAKAWVAGKGGGHRGPTKTARFAMAELTAMLKDLNDADKAANRMPATEYVELLMANQSRYFDRRRG